MSDHVVIVVYHVLWLLLAFDKTAHASRLACNSKRGEALPAADVNVVGSVAIYGCAELRSH